MSKETVSNPPAVDKTPAETPVSKVPFNPFTVLTVEQLTELLGKFPKQWRESNMVQLSNAQTEHGITDSEAIFLVWLQDEADSRILNKKVAEVAGRIINLVAAVGGTQSESALELIHGAYNELPTSHRQACGIKVQDAVKRSMVTAIAEEKLNKVYAKLGVNEKTWMRK